MSSGCWEDRQVNSWWDLLLEKGLAWQTVWHWLGIASLAVGVLLFSIAPSETRPQTARFRRASVLAPYKVVFRNPQSYLCGAVAGLLFVPTTIGDMTWGVAFFQRDRMFSFHDAVVTGSLVPLGWVIGCPAARLACGSGRPSQAGADRRRGRHAVVCCRHRFQYQLTRPL